MKIFSWLKNPFKKRAVIYSGWDSWLPATDPATGKIISPSDALTVSAVYRGINVLANPIGMLPLMIYKRLPNGGKERSPEHHLWKILRFKPNPFQDSFQFFHMMMTHILLRGNYYAQKIYNGRGDVLELYPLNPDLVCPYWASDSDENSLMYRVSLRSGKTLQLHPFEVLHVRAMAVCGVKGLSPIDLGMRTVGSAIAQEEHAGNFFGKGVRASGILEHPAKISKEAADRLRKSFEDAYSGASNAYRTILLEEGMKWSQVSLTNEQSQFIESRKFSVTDFARWIGVPPHKLYDLERATFSNIEHQSLEFVQDSLGPWLVAIERAMTTQLLPETEWDKTILEFLVDALLRGDIKSRYEAYSIGRNNGWLNADEIRERENMNPLPNGDGKIYLEPMNMRPVGQEDKPEEEEPKPEEDEKDLQDEEIQINAWKKILKNRVARALRREVLSRQRGNSSDDKMSAFLQEDLSNEVHSLIWFFASKLKPATRCKVLAQADESCKDILLNFSSDWVKTSQEKLESMEEWESERSISEMEHLFDMIQKSLTGESYVRKI